MSKVMSKVLFISKVFFLLVCFAIIFYLFLLMHKYYDFSVGRIILGFIPLFLVLFLFVISFFFRYNDLYFDLVCNFAFIMFFIIILRTFFDTNMVYLLRGHANYYYFESQLALIKILCYLMMLANVVLLIKDRKKHIIFKEEII